MEAYNNTQIKEKDETISQLESKIEKLNQELQGSNKESFMKATELNRENIKLQGEIERLKKKEEKANQMYITNKVPIYKHYSRIYKVHSWNLKKVWIN